MIFNSRPDKIGFEKEKKWEKTGNSFIFFFKWYLITLKFWALKNLTGFGRNFEKMVDKIRFLQIFSSELILQKIFNTYELNLIKFCTKRIQ